MNFKVGDEIECIFAELLPGNTKAPKLTKGAEYTCRDIHTDKGGYQHISVGLPINLEYVRSYATKEELPPTTHWCHPNRFIKKII